MESMNHTEIDRRAQEINADNNVRQLGTRTRMAIIPYLGDNVFTGKIHQNINTYAAFIAVLTDSGTSGFQNRRHKSLESLKDELDDAFRQAGFVDSDGSLAIPGRDSYSEIPDSIGPLMPGILAILEVEHGIDSTAAVRQHKPSSLEFILPDEAQESDVDQPPEKDWEAVIQNAPGFDLDAAAYVYVLELTRLSDSSTWFYVGKKEGSFSELLGYIRSYANKFTRSRVITYDDREILVGDYNTSIEPQGTTHHVVDVERIVPISATDLAAFDNPGAETCYILETERRTAYEVAIDHDTTNVLGGK